MIDDLTLIARASALARHASAESRIAAENVARADVPGYRARRAADFAETLAHLDAGVAPRATRAGHVATTTSTGASGVRVDGGAPRVRVDDGAPRVRVDETAPVAPNGNSVSIERERMAAAEAASRHRLALGIYGEVIDLVRLGLGRIR